MGPDTDIESEAGAPDANTDSSGSDSANSSEPKGFEVYGDSAYSCEVTLEEQPQRGHDMRTKVPPVPNANGYSKDRFRIDAAAGTVACPAHHTVSIRTGLHYPATAPKAAATSA